MPNYVCKGAKLKCSMGSTLSDLGIIHPEKHVKLGEQFMANIQDYKPKMNIMPFGQCKSLANPVVAAATAANFGVLQQMPCVPNTTTSWLSAKINVLSKGQPALMNDCKLMCMWGGIIEITNAGQTSVQTGATRITKVEKEELKKEGMLQLTKIKIITDFDVCCDEVRDFDDYQNFYILNDGGKYYHWLKNPTDERDLAKLEFLNGIIPITIHSHQVLKFEATFKVLFGNIDKATIEVKNSQKYEFKPVTITSKSEGDEFTEFFEATNMPYEDTIQFFEKFDLKFETTDCKSFLSKTTFRLYLTWKKPLWDYYNTIKDITNGRTHDFGQTNKRSLKVKNGGRNYILESLLFISCQSSENSLTEKQVVDKIFDHLAKKPLRVMRARDKTEALGYWRCSSALDPTMSPRTGEDFGRDRSVRFMLRVGDGRCGEWTEFFTDLCLTQGVEDVDMLPFNIVNSNFKDDANYKSEIFLVKKWEIRDPRRPMDRGGEAQGNDQPMNFFGDHVFSVYKGIFYDVSYGLKGSIKHSIWQNILKEYSPIALQGIPFAKIDPNGESFYDNLHSKLYVNPQTFDVYRSEQYVPKFIFKTINTDFDKYFIL